MVDLGSLVVLIVIACFVVCAWCFIIFYLCTHASTFFAFLTTNEPQSNELRLETRVGCPDGICYLQMFDMRHQDRIFTYLGYFPTIIAIASVPKSFRRKVKGKLEFIGDGVAHFEQSIGEGLVWDIVEGLVGRNEWVGGSELCKVSSVPPEGYRYLVLFLPEWRNTILQCLGPNPLLQTIIDIDAGYRTQFFGVLWQKETDKYSLEMELNMDVWEQLGRCGFGPEARIN
jgi:hypothetical protein